MPSPAAAKQQSQQSQPKLDLTVNGKQLSFQEKILQWQSEEEPARDTEDHAQEHASPASDISVEGDGVSKEAENTSDSQLKVTKRPSCPAITIAEPVVEKAVGRGDIKKANVPRKRIISDEHWRKERSSPKDGADALKKDASPTKEKKRNDNNGWNTVRANAWVRKRPDSAKTTPRKKSDGIPHLTPKSAPVLDKTRRKNDVKIAAAEIDSFKAQGDVTEPDVSLPDGEQLVHSNSARSTTNTPVKDKSDGRLQPTTPAGADLEQPKDRRSSDERRKSSRRRSSQRPQEAILKEKARSEPPLDTDAAPKSEFDKRIAAWLTATPDPFVDDQPQALDDTIATEHPDASPESETVTPLRKKSKEAAKEPKTDLSRGQREQIQGSRLRPSPLDRFRIKKAEDSANIESPPEDTLSPTLRRRGAQRGVSPTKRSPENTQRTVSEKIAELLDKPLRNTRRQNNDALDGNKYESRSTRDTSSAHVSIENRQTKCRDDEGLMRTTQSERRGGRTRAHSRREDKAISQDRPKLKRKLTSHADLMSVLSLPAQNEETIVSARSIKTARSKVDTATALELMTEVKDDEAKYSRELRTLVDGVIPVLLSHVLSKNKSAVTAGLFNNKSETDATSIIVNIGVVLERLKSSHKKVPIEDPEAFVAWARGSERLYSDYLRVWRMGFQDVVVNLAPAESSDSNGVGESKQDDGLPKDAAGYVVNGDGERVDVAFLLKRPLVRLKYLTKTLKGIHRLQPSEQIDNLVLDYETLVARARQRQDEERARLEDEAAASLDVTRARELQSLAPLSGVILNSRRCVKARDPFDMKLEHSSGQRYNCRVELILREESGSVLGSGDVLFCEIASNSKWLLFPPFSPAQLSARAGIQGTDIVVMIRGQLANGQNWHELITLTAFNESTALDWAELLGSRPTPPELRPNSHPDSKSHHNDDVAGPLVPLTKQSLAAATSSEVDMPIGEQASVLSKRWESPPNSPIRRTERLAEPQLPSRPSPRSTSRAPSAPTVGAASRGPEHPVGLQQHKSKTGMLYNELKFGDYDAQRQVRSTQSSPYSSRSPERKPVPVFGSHSAPRPRERAYAESSIYGSPPSRYSHRNSSQQVVSPDLRYSSLPQPILMRETSAVPSASNSTNPRTRDQQELIYYRSNEPRSSPASMVDTSRTLHSSKRPQSATVSLPKTPTLNSLSDHQLPNFASSSSPRQAHMRSSSPLKHEYEPSTASNSSHKSDLLSDDNGSVTSESSTEDLAAVPVPPLSVNKFQGPSRARAPSAKGSPTLSPSQSASQAPYRTVPEVRDNEFKIIASIFYWCDKGRWELLHPDECSIVVSPGLIEAFEMSFAHAKAWRSAADSSETSKPQPIVAQELTPLVPLRRGTAIDISIRSPPTENSRIKIGGNIMFRTRTGQECEALYNLINQARINNPTYIALQNARGPFGGSNWAAYMDRKANSRNPSSWWRLGSKKGSYRSGTRRSASVAQTESSVGTVASAISALKRLSSGSKMFNIGMSTISSRGALTRSSTTFTASSRDSGPVIQDLSQGTPAGITNAKIRLYERETASKWRDMGSARLTVMHPPRRFSMPLPSGHIPQEKRILITGTTQGETLLDVTLGETCFERVARTGIAVSVWEKLTDQNSEIGKTGGVIPSRIKVFMIQLKSEADAAYTFSLVGRSRY